MVKIQRLNMDTSWRLNWTDTSLIIDPWLVGSEVDSFSWLNEQWHTTEPIAPKDIIEYDAILISQSYSDHCHEHTLKEMMKVPVYASELAYKRLSSSLPYSDLTELKRNKWNSIKGLEVMSLHPGNKFDPVYFAHVIRNGDDAIFYSSHGFKLNADQKSLIGGLNFRLLITTFTEFTLPSIMGGKVNPGMKNVYDLVELLQPDNVINCHDEKKKMKGLVSKLANVKYQDTENESYDFNFIPTPDYSVIKI